MSSLKRIIFLCLVTLVFIQPKNVYAHCDGLDGPVVKSAVEAIEKNNVTLALIWIQKEDESIIKDLFSKTLSVRKLSKEAQKLADLYFYETLVRIHRAGEGEPYTGLKEAGRNLGTVIPAADLSIIQGTLEPLKKVYAEKNLATDKIEMLFKEVVENKNYNVDDVVSGRKYIKAYVEFLHTAEHIYHSDEEPDAEHKCCSEQTRTHHEN